MQAWRLARNIKTQWHCTSEPAPGKGLTFGPRGILRLPMRNDVFFNTRHALGDLAAVWRGCLCFECYKQNQPAFSRPQWLVIGRC